jgi:broad specificity phosphatase PhoE
MVRMIGIDNLENTIILSSLFKRARETAYECKDSICKMFYDELMPYQNSNADLDQETLARLERSKRILEYFISLDVISKDELRERYFGTLDGTILINYNKVWPVDNLDAHNKRYDVESVHEVIVRVSQLVSMLEQEYEGKHIVMASHADTLQIFQTYMSMSDPRKFSQYRFKNGEVIYVHT